MSGGPGKALGVTKKGNLGVGGDADGVRCVGPKQLGGDNSLLRKYP